MELPQYFSNNKASYQPIDQEDGILEIEPKVSSRSSYYGFAFGMFCVATVFVASRTFLFNNQYPLLKQSNIAKTTPFRQTTHPDPPTSLWGSISKPYPTGAFWTNLAVKNGDGPIGLYPYGIKTVEAGIQVSYGAFRRQVSAAAITDYFVADWQISGVQSYASRAIESYDNVSVTMTYKTINNGKYSAYLVKSSPFVTVYFENVTPVIASPYMKISSVEAKMVKDSTGTQYLVTLGNFEKWLVYCSESVILNWIDNALIAAVPIRGVIRIAILPTQKSEETFAALLNYVQRYPIGGSLSFQYPTNTQAVMNIHYNTVGTGQLLMLALPHHLPLLPPAMIENSETKTLQTLYNSIWCIKGRMHVILGDIWRLTYTLPSSLNWYYPVSDKISTKQLDDIAVYLYQEVKIFVPFAIDPYGFGKQLQRMARLAVIADNLGIADARQQAIYNLETSIIPWLQGMNQDVLLYDRTYGGLVSSYSVQDANSNFGAGWYSDHHFHYGYYLHAIAVIIKLDFPFYEANKLALDTFFRDIVNVDPTDLDFPFVRHKDFFDGHSWASGLFQQANGKGQESSSEAVNAYYGAYLYTLGIGNIELQKFTSLLTMMEIQATQYYWHMNENQEHSAVASTSFPSAAPSSISSSSSSNVMIYDSIFAASKMVGNLGALDVTTSTWFGNAVEYVHGINIMPLSPITGILFDSNFVLAQSQLLLARLDNITPTSYSPVCSANPVCVELHLDGNCCPTNDGIMLSCCDSLSSKNVFHDEWTSYLYITLAVIDRNYALHGLTSAGGFGCGNSRTNSIYWAASRPSPMANLSTLSRNMSMKQSDTSKAAVQSACAKNSACDAIGMLGECCPTATGVYLGCCPKLPS